MPRAIPLLLLALGSIPGGCAVPSPDPGGIGEPGVIRTGEREHVVRPGETFSSVARLYGIPVDRLRRANPGIAAERLPIGFPLRIPPAKPEVRRVESTAERR